MKPKAKTDWKKIAEDLKKERDDARAQLLGCRQGAEVVREELRLCQEDAKKMLHLSFFAKMVCCLILSLLCGWLYYSAKTIRQLQTPVIKYCWLEGPTVYRPDPKCTATLEQCQDEWRVQRKVINKLDALLKGREE